MRDRVDLRLAADLLHSCRFTDLLDRSCFQGLVGSSVLRAALLLWSILLENLLEPRRRCAISSALREWILVDLERCSAALDVHSISAAVEILGFLVVHSIVPSKHLAWLVVAHALAQ